MSLWLRLLWIYFRNFSKKKLNPLGVSVVGLMALPNDLDIYGHINNGRYLTLMDLGRIDLIWRTGMGGMAKKYQWSPLVGAVRIRYRKSLRVFQSFEIHTRILGWDQKWFYMEQTFRRGRREMVRATVQGLFRGPEGNIPPARVLHSLGFAENSPLPPSHFLDFA